MRLRDVRKLGSAAMKFCTFVLRPLLEEMVPSRSSTFCKRYSLITGFTGVFKLLMDSLHDLLHSLLLGGLVDDPDDWDASSQCLSLRVHGAEIICRQSAMGFS